MKKILVLSVLAAITIGACKKKEDNVSKLITVSYPTVTITTPKYFTYPVGGGPMPNANTILATAYDSFYHESIKAVVDASKLSSLVPGLCVATVSARNSYGFVGYAYVYVAITNITDSIDLTGKYVRLSNNDTVNVKKLSRGLYRTDDVAGVANIPDNKLLSIPGYFVQDGDALGLLMNTQPSTLGPFSGTDGLISMAPGDTTLQYVVTGNSNFGPALRLFKKL